MIEIAIERINASRKVLIGLSVDICLTSDWFHANRSTNVLIRIERTKIRISVKASFIFLAWARSEEHTSELSHTVISYAVFCLKKKKNIKEKKKTKN